MASRVQGKVNQGSNTIAFDSPVTAGNTIVVFLTGWAPSSPNFTTVTDNQGNTYDIRHTAATTGDARLCCVTASNVAAGSTTITVSGTAGDKAIEIEEWSGLDAAASLVDIASAAATGSGTSINLTATGTIGAAGNVVFAWGTHMGGAVSITEDTADGFTMSGEVESGASGIPIAAQYLVTGSTASVTPNFALGSSQSWSGARLVLKAAAGGTPTLVVQDASIGLISDNIQLDTANPYVVGAAKASSIGASRSPSLTFDNPPLENDVVIMWPSSTTTATITTPSGWVNVLGGNTDVESDSHETCCIYHIVTAGEAAANTVTFTATNLYDAVQTGNTLGCVVRNAEPTGPIAHTGSTFNSTNTVTPHVLAGIGTITTTNGLVLSQVVKDATGAYSSAPSGWTFLVTFNTNQGAALCQRNTLTTSGTGVSATNITPSAGDEYASITVVMAPKILSTNLLVDNSFIGWTIDSPTLSIPLIVADAAIGFTSPNVDLTQEHNLTVDNASIGVTAESATLQAVHVLTAASASIAWTVDTPTLQEVIGLVPADSSIGVTSPNITLTQEHNLSVDNASIGHTAESPTLAVTNVLAVQDAAIGFTAENVTVQSTTALVIQDVTIGHTATSPTLQAIHVLATQDAAIAWTIDNVVLQTITDLVVQNASIGSTAENVVLSAPGDLVVADASIDWSVPNVALTQTHNLTIQNATIGITADNVSLTDTIVLAVANALFGFTADNIGLTQEHNLTVQNAVIGSTSDNVVLALQETLVIANAAIGLTVPNLTLTQVHNLTLQDVFFELRAMVLLDVVFDYGGTTIIDTLYEGQKVIGFHYDDTNVVGALLTPPS